MLKVWIIACLAALGLGACSQNSNLPPAPSVIEEPTAAATDYRLGPLDNIQVFVWRSPELTATVPIRPDGRITLPLIEDMVAAGKTPSQLARDIEEKLKVYVQDPIVTVIVNGFQGAYDQQVRVVGQTETPQAIPFRSGMTLLDVIIAVGGVTPFADGNQAILVRNENGEPTGYSLRIDDLVRYGDISANVRMLPGDIIIIPEAWL